MPGQPRAGLSQSFPGSGPAQPSRSCPCAGGRFGVPSWLAVGRCVHPPGLLLSHLRPGPPEAPPGSPPGPCSREEGHRLARLRGLACAHWPWAPPGRPYCTGDGTGPCSRAPPAPSSAWAAPGPWGVLGPRTQHFSRLKSRLLPARASALSPLGLSFLLCNVTVRCHLPHGAAERERRQRPETPQSWAGGRLRAR